MASQPSTAPKTPPEYPGYAEWSRDIAVGLFVILPLWLGYEVLRYVYEPQYMNLAQLVLLQLLERLPTAFRIALTLLTGLAVLAAMLSVLRRDIPWVRVGGVIVLEGAVYGLILGPLAAEIVHHSQLVLHLQGGADPNLRANLIGALGAGIYEEIVFRLILMSGLAWLFMRACRSFGQPQWIGVALAVLASSLLFALAHYNGSNPEALSEPVFLFRTVAGLILGLLFLFRGLGVCVYTHALYDVFFYLNNPGS